MKKELESIKRETWDITDSIQSILDKMDDFGERKVFEAPQISEVRALCRNISLSVSKIQSHQEGANKKRQTLSKMAFELISGDYITAFRDYLLGETEEEE